MNNEFKKILNTAVGISAVIILISFIGLILNHAEINSALEVLISNSNVIAQQENTLLFIKWSSLALFLLCIPFFVGTVAGSLFNSDVIRLIAAIAGVIIILLSLVFIISTWNFAVIEGKGIDEVALSALSIYRTNLATLIVSAYFISLADILGMKFVKNRISEVRV